MTNKEIRMNTLKAAGIDTGKFVAMDVPEGATIIIATPDGQEKKYDKYGNQIDELLKKVKDIGFIKEDPHFRRWVMAQTFEILNSGYSYERFINYRKGGYYYQFEVVTNELAAIVDLPNGSETRKLREKFFTPAVVIGLCEDYMDKLRQYIENLPTHKCNGKPYKKVKTYGDVFVKDIEGVVFRPLEKVLQKMKKDRYKISTNVLLLLFNKFKANMVKFSTDGLKLYAPWLAAYQGEGAYYTATGLVKFHNCRVYSRNCCYGQKGAKYDLDQSLRKIEEKVEEIISSNRWYRRDVDRDWYLLTGMLKQIIEDNDFDFKKRMQEIYG